MYVETRFRVCDFTFLSLPWGHETGTRFRPFYEVCYHGNKVRITTTVTCLSGRQRWNVWRVDTIGKDSHPGTGGWGGGLI